MSWKRSLLSTGLRFSGLLRLLAALRVNDRERLTILAYHRIGGPSELADYPYDQDLISATAEDFAWQMNYVHRHFNPVTFRQVAAYLEGSGTLPRRALVVTFDDGFDDNYLIAFPILKQLGIPATFFVSTGYIGQRSTFWFDRVVYLVKNSTVRRLEIDLDGAPELFEDDIRARYQQAIKLVVALRAVNDEMRLQLLELIEQRLGAGLPPNTPQSQPMTWEMVVEMAAAGMEIGSHTVSHPNLVQLDRDGLERELSESRQTIEDRTGQMPVVVAYPVGDRLNFNAEVIEAAKAARYALGASYISGVNSLTSLDRFALTRLHVESYTDRSEFAAMLEFPEVFG